MVILIWDAIVKLCFFYFGQFGLASLLIASLAMVDGGKALSDGV